MGLSDVQISFRLQGNLILRPLDFSNPQDMRPGKMMPLSAALPLILGACALALSLGAAPDNDILNNPPALLSVAILIFCLPLFGLAYLIKSHWKAEYFGLQMLCLGSLIVFGIVPALCIAFYSSVPLAVKLAVAAIYGISHGWWCYRFIRFYSIVWNDEKLRVRLYQTDDHAAYYIQRGDRYLFEKKPGLNQYPTALWFVLTSLAALSSVPFASDIRAMTGLPYTHSFLALCGLPISMMGAGFAMRAWLVCFYYPRKIRQATGKPTLVDLTANI